MPLLLSLLGRVLSPQLLLLLLLLLTPHVLAVLALRVTMSHPVNQTPRATAALLADT
jgi:hypothetical protein